MTTLYVVAYDIFHNRRRYRVSKTLEGWGERVQESVFECWLTPAELQKLKKQLKRYLKTEEDRVRYYPLCSKDEPLIRILGIGGRTQDRQHIQI